MTQLTLSRRAEKTLRAMNETQFRRAREVFDQFITDRRQPSLNFEKLRGTDDLFSIRITHGDRAILRRIVDADGEQFEVVLIGPHDIYKSAGRL